MQESLDTKFVNEFYGIELTERDTVQFSKYSSVMNCRAQGNNAKAISNFTGISKSTIQKWLSKRSAPFLACLAEDYAKLKSPGNHDLKWLSLNVTRGGKFIGPWIKIPIKISVFSDIEDVIKQLGELGESNATFENLLAFAYLLGFMVGDATKEPIQRKNRINRRITIRLTTRFPTNQLLGNYVSDCANSLGLRMKKCKDCPPGKRNTHPFYTWISQSSELIQWFFEVCSGLTSFELTTYDKIRMDWLLIAPREFRINFLQGLADSDGFVDLSSKQVGVITEPNTELVEMIFCSLGVKCRRKFLTHGKLWCVMISYKAAFELPVFSPVVKSYRYQKVVRLYDSKIFRRWPAWLSERVESELANGVSGTKLVEKILNEYNLRISAKGILKRKIKISGGGSIKEKVCLGIESTAL